QYDPRGRAEAGHPPEERSARPAAAGHLGQHHAGRLPRQQAAADDEVQRRALGNVRPNPRGQGRGGLVAATPSKRSAVEAIGGPSGPPIFYFRHARVYRGHPRLNGIAARKTWMAGTSPAMTI